jgi:hypothetical protein
MTDWPDDPVEKTTDQQWPDDPIEHEPPLPPHVMAQATTYANYPDIAKAASQDHHDILSAFGTSFRSGFYEAMKDLGPSKETMEFMQKTGQFPKEGENDPFAAFNQTIMLAGAKSLDAITRLPGALTRGIDTTITGDPEMAGPLQSMWEAIPFGHFMLGGHLMPGAYKLAPPKPFVKPVDIKPLEGSPNPTLPRTQAALTGDPLIDAVLQHPVMQQVIENPVVDDSHTIPNSLGGSTPIENPTLYRDKDFPKQMTVDGVTFDTAEPSAVHENVEEFVIDALTKGGMDQATALKVAFWNFGEIAEDAWYRAHGMDPEKVEEKYTEHLNEIASRAKNDKVNLKLIRTNSAYDGMESFDIKDKDGRPVGSVSIKQDGDDLKIIRIGAKGGKQSFGISENRNLLRQLAELYPEANTVSGFRITGARAAADFGDFDSIGLEKTVSVPLPKIPSDLFKGTYPDSDPAKAAPGPIDKPTPEETAEGRAILAKHLGLDKEPPSHFTGGTGGPVDLRVAGDLGVIGDRPPIEGTPAEKAKAAIQPITAYHGSPYSFDAFGPMEDHVGTGEGAAAYGVGAAYTAENIDTAETYKQPGGFARQFIYVNGENVGNYTPNIGSVVIRKTNPKAVAASALVAHEDIGEARKALEWLAGRTNERAKNFGELALEELERLKDSDIKTDKSSGHLYQVRIHVDRDMMLDWDKPLSEHSDEVKKSLEQFGIKC